MQILRQFLALRNPKLTTKVVDYLVQPHILTLLILRIGDCKDKISQIINSLIAQKFASPKEISDIVLQNLQNISIPDLNLILPNLDFQLNVLSLTPRPVDLIVELLNLKILSSSLVAEFLFDACLTDVDCIDAYVRITRFVTIEHSVSDMTIDGIIDLILEGSPRHVILIDSLRAHQKFIFSARFNRLFLVDLQKYPKSYQIMLLDIFTIVISLVNQQDLETVPWDYICSCLKTQQRCDIQTNSIFKLYCAALKRNYDLERFGMGDFFGVFWTGFAPVPIVSAVKQQANGDEWDEHRPAAVQ
jgi:hypothetical protein